MPKRGSKDAKAIKLKLNLSQQVEATKRILDQIRAEQTFDQALLGIATEIGAVAKFPSVAIELFEQDRPVAKAVYGEQPSKTGSQMRVDLISEPCNGALILQHSAIVEMDAGLTQWIHNVATVLGIFCERFFLRRHGLELEEDTFQATERGKQELNATISDEREQWQKHSAAYHRLAEMASQHHNPESFYAEIHQFLRESLAVSEVFVALMENGNLSVVYPNPIENSSMLENYLRFANSVVSGGQAENVSYREQRWFCVPVRLGGAVQGVIGAHGDATFDERQRQILQFGALELGTVLERQHASRSESAWDERTRLPNPSLFPYLLTQRLAHARRAQEIVAILLLEIDGFSELPAPVRANLIKPVAEKLRSGIREGDVMVHRGEASFFCCISNLRNGEDIAGIAQKFLSSLSGPFSDSGKEYSFSGSLGVSLYPSDGADAKTLMQSAEAALAPAKKVKGNSYRFFTEGMNVKVGARLIFKKQLQQAMAKREFVLHYQPIFGIDQSDLQSVEAFVRWEKGGRMIYPGEFLETLSEMGLAPHLDDWVIRSACNERTLWEKDGVPELCMSVNLSPAFFWQVSTEKLAAILKASGAAPSTVMLEVGEKTLMQDIDKAVLILQRLRDFGVRLCLDDFGSGNASIAYLKRYPIDALKIDSSLIRALTDPNTAAVVATIISLAHRLKIDVIAEGIESQTELLSLQTLGCNSFQGRFRCPPLPGELLKQFVKKDLFKAENSDLDKIAEKTQPLPPMPQVPMSMNVPSSPAPVAPPPVVVSPAPAVVSTNPVAAPVNVHRITSPRRAVALPYAITCFVCQTRYNAMEADWCLCLSSEQTLVCPSCKKCFCKASLEYRHQVWDSAPETFWERKRQYESEQNGLPENLPPSQLKPPIVLIVDDERSVLKMAWRLVRQMGYSPILGHNGLEGLDLAKSYMPQLVLSDALLPKMDGREMCRLLKLDPKTARIKTVIMTASTGSAKHKPTVLKDSSFDEQIQKPVEFEKLQSILRKYL